MKKRSISLFIALTFIISFMLSSAIALAEIVPASTLTRIRMISDGVKREYRIYVPKSYDIKSPVPLVLNFHGSGGSPKGQFGYSDIAAQAEESGFIAVMPRGKYKGASWNAGLDPKGVDDVQFTKDVIKDVLTRYNINPYRIYSTGFSGGARMSSRLGCDLTETFAAIAPVAGLQFLDTCEPKGALPILTFHGQKDLVNHYTHQKNSRPYWTIGVEDSVAKWAKNNGCKPAPKEEKVSEVVTKLTYGECTDNAEVVFYRNSDGGHTWPGASLVMKQSWAGKTNADIKATALVWEFLEKYTSNKAKK